jgi:hypothetical protein
MAIQIIPIIKALTPLIASASGIVATLGERRSLPKSGAPEERIKKLEEDLLRMGEVVASALEQLQATANELRVQTELNESQESRLRFLAIFSVISLCLSVAAIVFAVMM